MQHRTDEGGSGPRGGVWGSVTDVPGVRLGHATRRGAGSLTGVTVVLPPPGTVGSVDVRGGGPGTHETDALDPSTLVPTVDAVVLTGGSAYGLVTASGVQAWLEEGGRGFEVRIPGRTAPLVVPIVPAACIFDLGRGGDPWARPDAALGRLAAQAAGSDATRAARGVVGAGTGALVAGQALKGGLGTASLAGAAHGLPEGVVVGAVAAVNALGVPADPTTGTLLGAVFVPPGLPRPQPPLPDEAAALGALLAPSTPSGRSGPSGPGVPPGTATTLAVVVTNARLDVAQCRRAATVGHDGIARGVRPAHTLFDGDTVFALATGEVEVEVLAVVAVQAAAADAVLLAVLDGVLAAEAVTTPTVDVPAYLDVCPSAAPR